MGLNNKLNHTCYVCCLECPQLTTENYKKWKTMSGVGQSVWCECRFWVLFFFLSGQRTAIKTTRRRWAQMLQMSCDEADPVGVVVAESQFSQHDLITVDPFEIRSNVKRIITWKKIAWAMMTSKYFVFKTFLLFSFLYPLFNSELYVFEFCTLPLMATRSVTYSIPVYLHPSFNILLY